MTSTQTGEHGPQKLLRVWPGVVAVVLQWVFRFGVKELFPGIQGFGYAVIGSLAFFLVIIAWWVFFSRARWRERLGALGLMAAAVVATWFLKHDSMWLQWLFAYAVPVISLAFVTWAVATRRLPNRVRHATMAATILISCGAWLLLRQDGINGDHNATFGWRWSPSAEERLLAQEPSNPTTSASETAPSTPATAPTNAQPTPAPATTEAAKPATPVAEARIDWPGFRGARRDGVVRGVKIKTDWSASPPVELWRRPVGPGWSSFAVNGDLIYTQEQRGEDEVVSCYRLSTGEPVWRHRDAARFSEFPGGPGPRATPTVHNGRVYTHGATGIVNALDASTGTRIWTRNSSSDTGAEQPGWGFTSSPLVVNDIVVVAASGVLVAYDVATGKPLWQGPRDGAGYSSPQLVVLDGVPQIVLLRGRRTTSFNVADGKVLWEHSWQPGASIVQP